jgi:CRISPR type III-B/RAMP module RAMP protein Cmr6
MPGREGQREGSPTRRGGGQRLEEREMAELKRSLPLYGGEEGPGFFAANQPFSPGGDAPHPGLVFDKFIDTWLIEPNGSCRDQKPSSEKNAGPKAKAGSKRAFFDERAQADRTYLSAPLTEAIERHSALVTALDGKTETLKTAWRFASGLGSGHPFETGFIWHRTLGVPYLSGSSVKGLIRAWAKPVAEGGWGQGDWNEVKRLFGDSKDLGTGALIVFDAIPEGVPEIEVDILNPHYSAYYSDPAATPPADYLSPKPVFFLAVKSDQPFMFSLAPRPGAYKDTAAEQEKRENDLKTGMDLLIEALTTIGAGAKTAVGYGVFTESGIGGRAAVSSAPATERWAAATLTWSKGNQTLIAHDPGGRKAEARLGGDISLLSALSEDVRRKLLDKGQAIQAQVVAEPVGNAFKIVEVMRQTRVEPCGEGG